MGATKTEIIALDTRVGRSLIDFPNRSLPPMIPAIFFPSHNYIRRIKRGIVFSPLGVFVLRHVIYGILDTSVLLC